MVYVINWDGYFFHMPLAVLPELQNQGIGFILVKEGLRIISNTVCPFVIMLGHEKYYPRFGFQRASKYGFKCQWEGVPDEAFMAMILNDSVVKGVSGIVRYRDEFDEAT
jgi:putative acetyltransferase